jgi:hypothetical protein
VLVYPFFRFTSEKSEVLCFVFVGFLASNLLFFFLPLLLLLSSAAFCIITIYFCIRKVDIVYLYCFKHTTVPRPPLPLSCYYRLSLLSLFPACLLHLLLFSSDLSMTDLYFIRLLEGEVSKL